MKKLDTPEIGDPSVSGSGGVSADGAGGRCFARVPVAEEPSVAPVGSPPPAVACDFACAPGATLEPPPDVFPCACWVRTCGVVVGSAGALATGEAGAGADSGVVVVAAGGVAGAAGAGVTEVVSVEVVGAADVDVSVEVV
jgi:hypothetical protein